MPSEESPVYLSFRLYRDRAPNLVEMAAHADSTLTGVISHLKWEGFKRTGLRVLFTSFYT